MLTVVLAMLTEFVLLAPVFALSTRRFVKFSAIQSRRRPIDPAPQLTIQSRF